ncbi:MAG: hypothetical protein IJD49_04160 [Clostridia bacterium]|nr:hypothetical protein [Clostridia bacterium]
MLNKLSAKLTEVEQGRASALKTIEAIDKQIANLGRQREQAVANLNAFTGAREAVLQLIDEANEEDNVQEVTADEKIQD